MELPRQSLAKTPIMQTQYTLPLIAKCYKHLKYKPTPELVALKIDQYQKQLSIYDWRIHTSLPIVSVLAVEETINGRPTGITNYTQGSKDHYLGKQNLQFPDSQNPNTITVVVKVEKINSLVHKVKLTFPQVLYVIQEAAVGFERLLSLYGPFHINQTNMVINYEGRLKVWHTNRFQQNQLPKTHNITKKKMVYQQFYQSIRQLNCQNPNYKKLMAQIALGNSFLDIMRRTEHFAGALGLKIPKKINLLGSREQQKATIPMLNFNKSKRQQSSQMLIMQDYTPVPNTIYHKQLTQRKPGKKSPRTLEAQLEALFQNQESISQQIDQKNQNQPLYLKKYPLEDKSNSTQKTQNMLYNSQRLQKAVSSKLLSKLKRLHSLNPDRTSMNEDNNANQRGQQGFLFGQSKNTQNWGTVQNNFQRWSSQEKEPIQCLYLEQKKLGSLERKMQANQSQKQSKCSSRKATIFPIYRRTNKQMRSKEKQEYRMKEKRKIDQYIPHKKCQKIKHSSSYNSIQPQHINGKCFEGVKQKYTRKIFES